MEPKEHLAWINKKILENAEQSTGALLAELELRCDIENSDHNEIKEIIRFWRSEFITSSKENIRLKKIIIELEGMI